MNTVMNLGKGKLTYTMGLIAIVFALVSLVTGSGDQDTMLVVFWAGMTTIGFRRAMSQ